MRSEYKSGICRAAVAAGIVGLGMRGAAAAPVFNDPGDVKTITSIENALATQMQMKDLIGYYAPDAFVEDIMTPGVYRGRKEISAAFDAQLAAVKSMKSDIADMNIASDGKFACAALRVNFDMSMKDGSSLAVSVRQLDAFKKIAGAWQIVQEHISVPLDDKTGAAVMSGKLPARGAMGWTGDLIAGPATTPAKAKAEIHQWLVTGAPVVDVDEMMTYFAPGGTSLLYDLTAPGEYRGASEIRAAYAPLMSKLSGAKDELLKLAIDSDGLMAVQIDTQNLKINFKDGTSKVISFRQSDCFRRVEGKWQTFAEMLSFPVDPKTGKSVTSDPGAFK